MAEEDWHMPIESYQYFIILFRVNQVFTFYHFIVPFDTLHPLQNGQLGIILTDRTQSIDVHSSHSFYLYMAVIISRVAQGTILGHVFFSYCLSTILDTVSIIPQSNDGTLRPSDCVKDLPWVVGSRL